MPQSAKMTTNGTSKKPRLYISPEVYNWLKGILEEGVPMHDEPYPDHIRFSVLNEVMTKVKHAYDTQG